MAAGVVVVDDNEPIRRMLAGLLRAAGHRVVGEAADGAAGVRETIAHGPDLVIMDWSMPVLDGVAATRELRARCPGIAVIAFSSAGDPQVRDAFLAAGAARYIPKPDVDALLAAVRALEPRPHGRPASGPDEPDEP
jgi:CheY-like chemotaxis protein